MRHRQWSEIIKSLSCSALETASDILLLHLFLFLEGMGGGHGGAAIGRAFDRAYHDLEFFKSGSFKRSTRHLSFRGWLKRTGRDFRNWRVTAAGRKRITDLFPSYKKHRPWDGKMYLVTYDIPEKRSHLRDVLREELRKLGCGMLQASVWMTPYYPRKILRERIAEHQIPGSIIVSDFGEHGSIGEQDLRDLIRDVYHLDELEETYEKFIRECSTGHYKHPVTLHCTFTTILRADPQLPFVLLPKPWVGTRAYETYKTTLRKLIRSTGK